ncbi:hypothetical protein RBEAN4_0782 [Rickettsia bellii str. RML An4]|uniref:Uncharacterized protein n=1 Tax=Rickettsia bellii str. RML An4 TaxID=1359193 RepID=A0A0F3QC00_RICBE|nr:hypothetical protein RBEAN4_0782 [Rickettsia bellii str. RML An4]
MESVSRRAERILNDSTGKFLLYVIPAEAGIQHKARYLSFQF